MMDSDQRNRMVLVIIGSLAGVGLIYSMIISPIQTRIVNERVNLKTALEELTERSDKLRNAGKLVAEADLVSEQVRSWDARMPRGAVYGSLLTRLEPLARTNGIGEFQLGSVIDLPEAISTNLNWLNYRGVQGSLSGIGRYRQLGKFVADVENELPFMRMTELQLRSEGFNLLLGSEEENLLGMQLTFEGCGYTNAVFQ